MVVLTLCKAVSGKALPANDTGPKNEEIKNNEEQSGSDKQEVQLGTEKPMQMIAVYNFNKRKDTELGLQVRRRNILIRFEERGHCSCPGKAQVWLVER